jgi:hypothetical protein
MGHHVPVEHRRPTAVTLLGGGCNRLHKMAYSARWPSLGDRWGNVIHSINSARC